MSEGKEERYLEWLTRMDIEPETRADVEKFTDYLIDELKLNDAQIDALMNANMLTFERYAPLGAHPVRVEYPWGVEIRWGVKGHPGLWSYEGMQELFGLED